MPLALPILAAITCLSDLRLAIDQASNDKVFAMTCTVVSVTRSSGSPDSPWVDYVLTDATGGGRVAYDGLPIVQPGTLVSITGRIGHESHGWNRAYAKSIKPLGHGTIPPPRTITATQLNDLRFDSCLVTLSGIFSDLHPDDVDPNYAIITFRSPHGPFKAIVKPTEYKSDLTQLIGAEIAVTGIAYVRGQGGKRHFQNAMLFLNDRISILKTAPSTPFDVPDISDVSHMSAAAVANMNRRKTCGQVIARLRDSTILLQTANRRIVKICLAGDAIPACGDSIEASGFPETDLFSLILTCATYRPAEVHVLPDATPSVLSSSNLLVRSIKGVRYQSEHYGRLARLNGIVECSQRADGRKLTLSSDGETFDLDLTSCPSVADLLQAGAHIELTGICVFETEIWTASRINPRIRGITIAPRSGTDVKIVKTAPWWTMQKLLIAFSALFAALIAILIWNRWLQCLVERRGRQLFKAKIAQAQADLRVEDRTRLAADIHDSIAQTLTGVGFQIDAAAKTLSIDDRTACANFLVIAKRTLLSCREELRRCLWDLRAHAIENPDLTAAISETIRPVIGSARISVRFNVPRAHLSDSTTHAMLCIIRELVSNAIRHGKANRIRVAGEHRGEHVRISVSDNGTGFDPASRPGPSQGHFGLQGIRERLAKLNGEMTIESSPGEGTHIIVEIGK